MSDDETADRLFEAAVEFLARTGVYCDAANHLIRLGRAEILDAANALPEGSTFGEGRGRRLLRARKPEDKQPPWYHVATGIMASSEEVAMAQVEGHGSIPQADSIGIPAFGHVRGMPVAGGSPLEIHATVASVQTGRRALERAGRPGLPIMSNATVG